MNENVIFPIGNIVMLDIIKKDYGYFDFILVAALNNLTRGFKGLRSPLPTGRG
jgi:hypothetical protein